MWYTVRQLENCSAYSIYLPWKYSTQRTQTFMQCFLVFHWTLLIEVFWHAEDYPSVSAKTAINSDWNSNSSPTSGWRFEMGQQQSLHLPLALITVKIISYRRLQVKAGNGGGWRWELWGQDDGSLRGRVVGVGFATEVSVEVIGNEDCGHDGLKGRDPGGPEAAWPTF